MAQTLTQRMMELGVPFVMANELVRQINSGVYNVTRLINAGWVEDLARYLATSLSAGTFKATRAVEYSMIPAVATLIAGGGRLNLVLPRLGMIGPSTVEQNIWAANVTPFGVGDYDVGPIAQALMLDRRIAHNNRAKGTSKYHTGDNLALEGTDYRSYPTQIALLGAEMASVPDWGCYYEVGRNYLDGGVDALIAATIRDIADLQARGAKFVILAGMWPRTVASGGDWIVGGVGRSIWQPYNSWLSNYVIGRRGLQYVDFASLFVDYASPNLEPYAWVTRSDGTHLTPPAAQRAGKALFVPVFKQIAVQRSYPARPVNSPIGDLTGNGGTKSGVTGPVPDGWNLSRQNGTSTCVASIETIRGEFYQRLDISNSNLTTVAERFRGYKTNIIIPEGMKAMVRGRVLRSVTSIPNKFFIQLGDTTLGQGDASASRVYALALAVEGSVTAGLSTQGTAPFLTQPGRDSTEYEELWVESSGYVLGAPGGSSVALVFALLHGQGASNDTLTIKFGEFHIFEAS